MKDAIYRIMAFGTPNPDFASDECSEVTNYSDEAEARVMFMYWTEHAWNGGMLIRSRPDGSFDIIRTWNGKHTR